MFRKPNSEVDLYGWGLLFYTDSRNGFLSKYTKDLMGQQQTAQNWRDAALAGSNLMVRASKKLFGDNGLMGFVADDRRRRWRWQVASGNCKSGSLIMIPKVLISNHCLAFHFQEKLCYFRTLFLIFWYPMKSAFQCGKNQTFYSEQPMDWNSIHQGTQLHPESLG